jgi:hypothetical protein
VQVLQAKYYPNADLLNAGPKNGSSFTWQSIVVGIQTFKRGHIWRVGNGKSINIWKDFWIPGSPSRKIETPRGNVICTTINALINPGQWDEILINDLFHPLDVGLIMRITLSTHMQDDFVAWHKKFYFFGQVSLLCGVGASVWK